MILWCMSCKEYRKRGTGEWHKCKWREHHYMTPANEKLENELQKIRAGMARRGGSGGGQNNDEDLKRLGMLEAIKNVDAVDDDEHGRVDDTVERMVARQRGPVIRSGDSLLLDQDGRYMGCVKV